MRLCLYQYNPWTLNKNDRKIKMTTEMTAFWFHPRPRRSRHCVRSIFIPDDHAQSSCSHNLIKFFTSWVTH